MRRERTLGEVEMAVAKTRTNERRANGRAAVDGIVMLLTHDGACGHAIDLSRGGLRLQLDPDGPHSNPGERLTVELELAGAHDGEVRLDGRVQRATRAGEVAVIFTIVPPEFAALVAAAPVSTRPR
ncbi:MAG: PilZ domain-containing protein [Deltaproteobacteria bacterium]|nr:PilZ domain-containing protein [Deltaproteobacteria bacterium]